MSNQRIGRTQRNERRKRFPRKSGLAASAVLLATVAPALPACDCVVDEQALRQWVETSDPIFAGRAESIRPVESPRSALAVRIHRFFAELFWEIEGPSERETGTAITFAVEHVWRGTAETGLVLVTGRGGGDCGYEFEPGQRYVVYVRRDAAERGVYDVSICGWTAPLLGPADAIDPFNLAFAGRTTNEDAIEPAEAEPEGSEPLRDSD